MYNKEIDIINQSLEKTGKAIISFGCSFTDGQGAIPLDILENYDYVCPRAGILPTINFKNDLEKDAFLTKYPEARINPDGTLNLRMLERKHSFVNILCNRFFSEKYTPINFGLAGHGNKASIAQINFFPHIKWHLIKELIVVYLPSDPARLSFVNDEYGDNAMFTTIWPHPNCQEPPKNTLWTGYFEALYTDKFAYLEAINDMCNLRNWAQQFNHKLIVLPAFSNYTKQMFEKSILCEVKREVGTAKLKTIANDTHLFNRDLLVNLIEENWPWDNMWSPDGKMNWAELLESYEDPSVPLSSYISKGSPNKWITPCIHPSAKAHIDLAEKLHTHITTEKL